MIKSFDENLESLSRAILSDAHAEADQILTDAKARADAIRQNAQNQAKSERDELLGHAAQEAERLHSQAMAASDLKARTMMLARREKLLDNVFNAVRKQLPMVQQWSDYEKDVLPLLRDALSHLNAPKITVRADEFTLKFLTDNVLDEISKELNETLKLGKPLEHGTGVWVETVDGHLHYDNTLETRLSRIQNQIRSQVYHLLMGESI